MTARPIPDDRAQGEGELQAGHRHQLELSGRGSAVAVCPRAILRIHSSPAAYAIRRNTSTTRPTGWSRARRSRR